MAHMGVVSHGGLVFGAVPCTLPTVFTHDPLDGAAGNIVALAA